MQNEKKKKRGGQCRSHNTTDWLIIADGEPLLKSTTQQWAKNKSILVLDGALPTVLDDEITPQIVMGDFDSVDPTLLNKIKLKILVLFTLNVALPLITTHLPQPSPTIKAQKHTTWSCRFSTCYLTFTLLCRGMSSSGLW